jgi:hypothetical protein
VDRELTLEFRLSAGPHRIRRAKQDGNVRIGEDVKPSGNPLSRIFGSLLDPSQLFMLSTCRIPTDISCDEQVRKLESAHERSQQQRVTTKQQVGSNVAVHNNVRILAKNLALHRCTQILVEEQSRHSCVPLQRHAPFDSDIGRLRLAFAARCDESPCRMPSHGFNPEVEMFICR